MLPRFPPPSSAPIGLRAKVQRQVGRRFQRCTRSSSLPTHKTNKTQTGSCLEKQSRRITWYRAKYKCCCSRT
uniref:Uncharacterized protein n=1 Tax=Physcomitrium patens TaxID=3218 RepID=A0A2K1LAV9_PHYPA|nr:hypothetical protein PHYPA_001599 [Physcomitrium patens]